MFLKYNICIHVYIIFAILAIHILESLADSEDEYYDYLYTFLKYSFLMRVFPVKTHEEYCSLWDLVWKFVSFLFSYATFNC